MIWPFLLAAYVVCIPFNWRAGLVFICGLGMCRVLLVVSDNEQLAIFAAYSCLGVVAFLFLDRIASAALCVVAILYGVSLIDLVDAKVKNIGAEIVFLVGVFLSAYFGPTGGLLGIFDPADNRRGDFTFDRASNS